MGQSRKKGTGRGDAKAKTLNEERDENAVELGDFDATCRRAARSASLEPGALLAWSKGTLC